MNKVFPFFAFLFCVNFTFAQTPTWSKDIAPILYKNCTNCHHPGGAGHGSLMTYTDALGAASNIQYQTSSQLMPPWPPDRKYSHFAEERFLTKNELSAISNWVNAGSPQGNLADAPTPPIYSNTDVISAPDLSLKMPPFTVFSNTDLYQCFVLPTNLTVDEFMTGLEIVPGNGNIVHHVLIYMDTTSSHKGRAMDAADPKVGYTSFGGVGFNAVLVGGWVPGTRPQYYPANMGIKIKKNSDLIIQVHYPKNSLNQVDSTKINLKLTTTALREIALQPALNHVLNITPALSIPANQTKIFNEHFTIPTPFSGFQGISIVTIAPHAHLICKNWLVFAVTAANDTIPLIKIDNWDFKWQGFYNFQKPIQLAAGTTLFAKALYDNTSANLLNPNSPPLTVNAGEATTDEMMLVYFAYLIYQPGDENIIIDSTNYNRLDSLGAIPLGIQESENFIANLQVYDPIPNPALSSTKLTFYAPKELEMTITLFSIDGKKIKDILNHEKIAAGFGEKILDVSNLSNGEYILKYSSSNLSKSKRLLISK